MALPTKSITWDNLESSTTMDFDKVLVDNIFNKRPFLYLLNQKKQTYTGGESMNIPLIYAESSNKGDYNGYQELTTTETKQFTTANYHIAHYYTNLVISKTDMEKNRGNTAVFDLVKAKYQVSELTMEKQLTTALFGSETAAPKLIGLGTHCPTSANTLGGIDGSVETWWANQTYDATSLASLTMAKMQAAWGEASDGTTHPTVIVTTQTIYDKIWSLADAKQRLGVESLVKLGFNNIEFNGVPIIVDKACTAAYMYMLNLDYLYLKVSDQDNMATTDWLTNTKQLAKVKYITWTGQLVSSNRRYQQVVYNLS